jgi:hypothetical protein
MKGIKKSIGTGISIFLLLCFSVTVLPMDFFHNHSPEQSVCKEVRDGKSCNHSLHISTKASYCWVCAIHFDSQFTGTSFTEKISLHPTISLFSEGKVSGYFVKILLSALRGPPQD